MDEKQIISNAEKFVKERFSKEGSDHDWWHIQRVWNLAKHIAKKENVDLFPVELAALFHDMADWKICDEEEKTGLKNIENWLIDQGVDTDTAKIIVEAIEDVSFSRSLNVKDKVRSKIGEVVQDADRLDAIGALAIARCFTYGGRVDREIYNPDIKPRLNMTTEEYRKIENSTSINHFYEKLLLLKDKINTKTAKEIAVKRHEFMEEYLKEFFEEWEGKR